MNRTTGVTFGVFLLLLFQGNVVSQASCPARCQCFSPTKVLCADERMTGLPRDISAGVKDLIVMTTGVAYLYANTLQESAQLAKLVFLNNALRDIHTRAFEDLVALEELEISGNPWLERLFAGTFSKQGNLTKLMLNFNRFKTMLPGTFDALSKLEYLQMKGDTISHLPTGLFQYLQKLRSLDLSQNVLEEIDRETFAGLVKLEFLKLDYNLIGGLSSDTFHNVSWLKELSLQGNKISDLPPDVFSVLKKLEVLNLRGNQLSNFSTEALGIFPSSMKELTLTGNRLVQLSPDSLRGLSALTYLSLSSNQLYQLPAGMFENLTALENLHLSENLLTSLPERIFSSLGNLKVVHLQGNNLSEVDAKLFEDQHFMQQLYLSDNKLQALPSGLFDPFIFQNIMRLHGNPWICDCHMWYLHDWVMQNRMDIEEVDKLLCTGPGSFRGQTITSVDKDHLVCHISKDVAPRLESCTVQATNDTMVVKCRVTKCSPLRVRVQFHEEDGSVVEHTVERERSADSQCDDNITRTVTASP